jgi:hypothetical protein
MPANNKRWGLLNPAFPFGEIHLLLQLLPYPANPVIMGRRNVESLSLLLFIQFSAFRISIPHSPFAF